VTHPPATSESADARTRSLARGRGGSILIAVALSLLPVGVDGCGQQRGQIHTIGVAVTGPSNDRTSVVVIDGHAMPETMERAKISFGQPSSAHAQRGNPQICVVRWASPGLTGIFTVQLSAIRYACNEPNAATQTFTTSSANWRTTTGLSIGDAVGEVKRLYPRATSITGGPTTPTGISLASYFYAGDETQMSLLSARVTRGQVSAFVASGTPDE
jgi:hypothetical protein